LSSQIQALAALQRLDQSLRDNTQTVEAGQRRVAEIDEALRKQQEVAAAARSEVDALAARQRDLEARLADAEARMKDKRMRITRIRNDKELGLAKREVDLLKEESSAIETELVTVIEQVEAATARRDAAEQALGELTAARETEASQLAATIERLGSQIEEDRARRVQLVAEVDGDLHRRYEMIFSRRNGVAVVAVRGGTCQGCHMHVPPQLFNQIQRGGHVIVCPSCQRMLYWQPDTEEDAR
jgi:predicted  nucleic acid-binding Zn-ribbon protein